MRIAGVDGCPAGWVAVVREAGRDRLEVVARFADLFDRPDAPDLVVVDMPIGLPARAGPGGRGPEALIRPLLGARQSSVFSVPSRAAVEAGAGLDDGVGYREACRVALATSDPPRKISKQAYFLFPKIREIDALLRARPELRERVYESHPELAFRTLAGGAPMATPKKVKSAVNAEGVSEREALLVGLGLDAELFTGRPPRGVGHDDRLDAAALVLVAERIARGEAVSYPQPPGRDEHGLAVAIWT